MENKKKGIYESMPFRVFATVTVADDCLLQQGSILRFDLRFLRRNDDRGGNLVFIFEMQQADALGGAAGGADGLGIDADDLAVLADDHQLRCLVDQLDGADLAVARSRLDVDNTLAAAGLQTVFVHIRALAVALFGDGENEAGAVCAAVFLAALLGVTATPTT